MLEIKIASNMIGKQHFNMVLARKHSEICFLSFLVFCLILFVDLIFALSPQSQINKRSLQRYLQQHKLAPIILQIPQEAKTEVRVMMDEATNNWPILAETWQKHKQIPLRTINENPINPYTAQSPDIKYTRSLYQTMFGHLNVRKDTDRLHKHSYDFPFPSITFFHAVDSQAIGGNINVQDINFNYSEAEKVRTTGLTWIHVDSDKLQNLIDFLKQLDQQRAPEQRIIDENQENLVVLRQGQSKRVSILIRRSPQTKNSWLDLFGMLDRSPIGALPHNPYHRKTFLTSRSLIEQATTEKEQANQELNANYQQPTEEKNVSESEDDFWGVDLSKLKTTKQQHDANYQQPIEEKNMSESEDDFGGVDLSKLKTTKQQHDANYQQPTEEKNVSESEDDFSESEAGDLKYRQQQQQHDATYQQAIEEKYVSRDWDDVSESEDDFGRVDFSKLKTTKQQQQKHSKT